MHCRRLMAAIGAVGLVWALATPVLAQGNSGRGGGGNKPPQCVGDGEQFPATLQFLPNGAGPQIYASDGMGFLDATVNSGNVASRTEDSMGSELPVTVDFRLGDHGYQRQPGDQNKNRNIVATDPHVSTWVFTTDLDSVPCQMFGMTPDDETLYRMRMTVQWHENDEGPQPWGTKKADKRWKLRYRPHKDEPRTWLDAKRVDANTWELTSRPDSLLPEGTLLAHFADLEERVEGNKPNQPVLVHTTPVMPIRLRITVDCGGACPIDTGGF